MTDFDQYVGKKFSKLTILSVDKKTTKNSVGNYYRYCDVRCDCGVEKRVQLKFLKNGKTKTCGCGQKRAIQNTNYDRWESDPRNDRIGQKQGLLTVLKRDYSRSSDCNNIYWVCRCECGRRISIPSHKLNGIGQQTKSCRQCYVEGKTKHLIQNQE